MSVPVSDLYTQNPSIFEGKTIAQVISFCGEGKLLSGNAASREFRSLLELLPSTVIASYIDNCLGHSFENSGFALQDLVNQVGRRLGFTVEHGSYKGVKGKPGQDGIWQDPNGHVLVVEIKTTDAYRINLDVLAGYRRQLASHGKVDLLTSSILIVTGRQDTGDLEAQVRGSRHAWDIRIISVDALLRLMRIKEDFADESTVAQISDLLKPIEYTRVDKLVDIIFATSSDLLEESLSLPVPDETKDDIDQGNVKENSVEMTVIPASFHDECIRRLSTHLKTTIVKEGRNKYRSPTGDLRIVCAVSRTYESASGDRYWFGFHPSQQAWLSSQSNSYVALGCGSADSILYIPFKDFEPLLINMQQTKKPDRYYWHVRIGTQYGKYCLGQEKIGEKIDVSSYLLDGV